MGATAEIQNQQSAEIIILLKFPAIQYRQERMRMRGRVCNCGARSGADSVPIILLCGPPPFFMHS